MNEYLKVIFKSIVFTYVNNYAVSFFMNDEISLIENRNLAKLVGINFSLFILFNKVLGVGQDCNLPDITIDEVKLPKLDVDVDLLSGIIPSISADGLTVTVNYFKFVIIKVIILAVVTEFAQLHLFKIKDSGYKMEWFTQWFGILASMIFYDLIVNQLFTNDNRSKKHGKSISKIRRLSFIIIFSKIIAIYMLGGDLTNLDQSWFITAILSIITIIVYVLYFKNTLFKDMNSTLRESLEVYIIFISSNLLYNLSTGNLMIGDDILEISTSWSGALLLANLFIKNILKSKT